jgi:DNA-binding transcriptional MerR regulator
VQSQERSVRIGAAAARLGVTPRTIKYYEELGLLAPERAGGNYRDYDDDDLQRVERIRHLQQLGFSLAAIREILKYRAQVDETGRRRLRTSDLEAVIRALEAQLAAVRQRVARARADVEQGERLAADLEGDLARCRERLALRGISPSSGRRGH